MALVMNFCPGCSLAEVADTDPVNAATRLAVRMSLCIAHLVSTCVALTGDQDVNRAAVGGFRIGPLRMGRSPVVCCASRKPAARSGRGPPRTLVQKAVFLMIQPELPPSPRWSLHEKDRPHTWLVRERNRHGRTRSGDDQSVWSRRPSARHEGGGRGVCIQGEDQDRGNRWPNRRMDRASQG